MSYQHSIRSAHKGFELGQYHIDPRLILDIGVGDAMKNGWKPWEWAYPD